jgi:D-3-phosphoglycerate dehydrogenase
MKIVLVENIHKAAIDLLKQRGFDDITALKDSPQEKDLIEILETADAIGIRTRTKLTKEILQHCKNIKVISNACIGTDQVDLDFARKLGIPDFNAPFGNTRSVAELTIGEMILLARKVPEKNEKAHRGIWDKSLPGCFEVKGKTIGIIGYGHIGTQVGILAESLSMNVVYYDIEKKQSYGGAKALDSMDELLKISDVVTVHVPNLPTTENMFSIREFNLMKKNSLFLNIARGKVVDIDALAEVIENGHLAGAGIDVYKIEPKNKDEELVTPLRKFQNVILTPHIGGLTEEAQISMALDMAEKMADYLQYGSTLGAVNFPEIQLKNKLSDTTRILHIHENIPGVMQELNEIFGRYNINVDKQYLDTYLDLGYVVTDIRSNIYDEKIVNDLNKVKTTKKVIII